MILLRLVVIAFFLVQLVHGSNQKDASSGDNGLCVVGCTPYVDQYDSSKGIRKYEALALEMAEKCDVIVHVGDTKPGKMACNRTLMTNAVHILKDAASAKGAMVLYAPGDNELNDCHRHNSSDNKVPSDIYKAADARQWLIDDLKLLDGKDVTGKYTVKTQDKSNEHIPGTNQPYNCAFHKYVEFNDYAVATLEVIGSHMYLDDERNDGYPYQDETDPLAGRLPLFLQAKDCGLEWIEESAASASKRDLRALFFLFHATFYGGSGKAPLGSNSVGEYYNRDNLKKYTEELYEHKEDVVNRPYKPLFDKLTATAKAHPDLMFYVVHSDAHRFLTIRMNPTINNKGEGQIESHHNMMIHQVEGASRSLTMYSKFTVDRDSFQPVTLKQEWSEAAYSTEPYGHSWIPY